MDIKDIAVVTSLLKGKAIEQVSTAVNDWLDDHPEATTTVEDGAITKAKLTSTLKQEIETNTSDVSDLKSAINTMNATYKSDFATWTNKFTITSAGVFQSNPSTAVSDYYPVNGGSIVVNQSNDVGMNDKSTILMVAEYKNQVFKTGKRTAISGKGTSVTLASDTDAIRFVFGYANASQNEETLEDVAANFGAQIIAPVALRAEVSEIEERVEEIKTDVDHETELASNPLNGYVASDSGAITSSSSFRMTDYVPVVDGVDYYYTGLVYANAGGAAYNSNKEYIGALFENYPSGSSKSNYKLTIPNGTAYIVVCSTSGTTLSLKGKGATKNVIQGEIDILDNRITTIESNAQTLKPEQLTSVSLFERIAGCGDSYSSGAVYGLSSGSGLAHYGISWPEILGRKCGVTGVSFSKIGESAKSWLTDCLPDLKAATPCNLYIILLGINAEPGGVGSIEDVDDSDPTQNADTYYGNMARIYHEIHDFAPSAKIMFARPPMVYGDKVTALQTLAARYGVPYLSYGNDPYFSTDFYQDNRANTHPLAVTYAGMAVTMEKYILQAMVENPTYFADYVGND